MTTNCKEQIQVHSLQLSDQVEALQQSIRVSSILVSYSIHMGLNVIFLYKKRKTNNFEENKSIDRMGESSFFHFKRPINVE